MKKIPFLKKVLILSMFSFIAGCFEECDPEDACAITQKADVLLKFVKPFLKNSSQTDQIYSITFNILNTIEGLSCDNPNVATTPDFGFNYKVMYSATDSEVKNGKLALERTPKISSLAADKSGDQIEELKFNKDGYYAFDTFTDNANVVDERNESNNTKKEAFSRSNSDNNNQTSHSFIIHVKGVTNPDIKFDADGKPILVEILNSTFKYQ